MRLSPGTVFGVYKIEELVGTGGMGEVYRATDTRLRRTVALKVLPESVVIDADRSARFRREAQLLAALNHQNVGSIYDVAESSGAHALVLEFVDGETLADRLARGAIPLDDAIAISRQIASALDSAHRRGIVHRDLKPSNIAITPDGQVKLLDFGIAKALQSDDAGVTVTGAYTRVGTPSYMSPEQARGELVDQRADIWAFGCVMYEMVTGHRAFPGHTPAEAMSAVLRAAPHLEAVPLRLRPLVRRCLDPNPARRLRDIADADLWLDGPAALVSDSRSVSFRANGFWRPAAFALFAALVVLSLKVVRQPRPELRPFRFEFSPPEGVALANGFSVSPDGRRLAFIGRASDSSTLSLWVHSFESGVSEPIPSIQPGGAWPIWSPDGRSLALMTGRMGAAKLERLSLDGMARQTLFDSQAAQPSDWNDHDEILFTNNGVVMRIPSSGGRATQVTTLDRTREEVGHYSPRFLPDGTHFVYLRLSASEGKSGICVGSIDVAPEQQDARRLIMVRGTVAYAPSPDDPRSGFLLFNRDGTLFAQGFDAAHLELRGDSIRVADHVFEVDIPARPGLVQFSRAGTLAYRTASTTFGTPYWFDRAGQPIGPALDSQFPDPQQVRISPDSHRLALTSGGDIWVGDVSGAPPMKITTTSNADTLLWAPDGQRLIYETTTGLRSVRIDGAGSPETISPPGHYHPDGWSGDAKELVVTLNTYSTTTTGWDILKIVNGSANPQPVLNTPANEGFGGASLSIDGKWLAYTSDVTGLNEIYMRPYPGPGEEVRVSHNGGSDPLFSKDGRELYYWEGTRLMGIFIDAAGPITTKPPNLLFDSRNLHVLNAIYDVAPDGRFVMIKLSDKAPIPSPIKLIANWTASLRAVRP